MYSELYRILDAHFISTEKTDVFEETLLKVAGITAKPTKCQFNSQGNPLTIIVTGLTPADGATFLAFIQACGDQQAVLTDKYFHGVAGFKLEANVELIKEKLLAQFAAGFATLEPDVIANYREQSIGDHRLRNQLNDALNANHYADFKQELDIFLEAHYISESATGIFARTFLAHAGISQEVGACQIGASTEEKMFFRVQGLTEQNAELFAQQLKKLSTDSAVSVSYIKKNNPLDLNNDSNRLENAHECLVDKALVYTQMLPLFKQLVAQIANDKMDAYQALSLSDHNVKYRVSYDVSAQKRRLLEALEPFLIPQFISAEHCQIFAETLFQLAAGAKAHGRCQASPKNQHLMQFTYQGITQDTANQITAYFQQLTGDLPVTSYLVANTTDVYQFLVAMDQVIEVLVPKFKEAVVQMTPEQLAPYVQQSERHEDIQTLRFQNALTDILSIAARLELNCPDAYTKGELHLVNRLLTSLRRLVNGELSKDEAGHGQPFVDIQIANIMYQGIFAENPVLNNDNEDAKLLKDRFVTCEKPIDVAMQSIGLHGLFRWMSQGNRQSRELFDSNDELNGDNQFGL